MKLIRQIQKKINKFQKSSQNKNKMDIPYLLKKVKNNNSKKSETILYHNLNHHLNHNYNSKIE
jgi:hypothetical protein